MNPVIVYSKDNCPQCTQLKTALGIAKIDFKEINIERQPEARELVVGRGFRQMPVINDNENWMSGFNQNNFIKIVAARASDVRPMA